MHEISLVQGLLAELALLAEKHESKSISKVRVEVGPLSGIVVDSFQFGFDVLSKEDDLTRHADLEIITPPQQYRCVQCGDVFTPEGEKADSCVQCGHGQLVPQGGDGLILLQVEME